jgi:Zn-dependent M28 family amino/carboxypeptidase
MTYSGSGDVTAAIRPVDVVVPIGSNPANTSTSGCEATDFANAGFQAGEVALLQRGTCSFRLKAENAAAAGASAVVVMNEGQPGRDGVLAGTLNPPPTRFDRPVLGTSYAVGVELVELYRSDPNVTVHIFTQTIAENRQSSNIIAEAKVGDPNNVTMSGAHLDSVLAGPGINDNGSGSSALLEVAVELAKKFDVNKPESKKNDEILNRPRFAWWGAEEQGLIGSRHYANQLSSEQRAQIDLYLNYDMNGSPNFVRFVGDGSAGGPPGSDKIEQLYIDYFTSQGLATDPAPFNNRSDYGAFTPFGIPAGFLFTGAEETKTAAQAQVYGGTAGVAYDPCDHQACDTLANVNKVVLKQMLEANAFAKMCWLTSPPLDAGTGGPAAGACFSARRGGDD